MSLGYSAMKRRGPFLPLLVCAALLYVLYVLIGNDSSPAALPALALPEPGPAAAQPAPLPALALPEASRPAAPSSLPASTFANLLVLFATTAPDSVGYSGAPASSAGACIHPPPFGEQCTMLADSALHACLRLLPGCTSLTCPDPGPYAAPHPRIPRPGPICQARSASSAGAWRQQGQALEAAHPMCAPSGCTSLFLARLAPSDLAQGLAGQLAQALAARGLRHQDTLLAWAGDAAQVAAAKGLLALPSLQELGQLAPSSSSSSSSPQQPSSAGPWLLHAAAPAHLREQLGAGAAPQHPWLALPPQLTVYLYPQ